MDELFDDVDVYFKQEESAQEALRKPSFSLEKSNDNIHTYKTKINSQVNKNQTKGKYLEKIKNYLPNNEHFQQSIEQEEQQSLLSLSKRQRNRISAKQSRDRKKLYIGLMQHEHKKLQKQLNQVTKQIQQTKEKINKFCSENKTTHGFSSLSQLQSKLQQTLEKKQKGYEQSVTILLDSISFRMGGTGRERIQKQAQCFKQIINLSLPALHRYLMWASTEQKHVFSPNFNQSVEGDDFPCPVLSQISQNHEQRHQILQSVRKQIVNKKKQLLNLFSKLEDSKCNLELGIKYLQQNMVSLRDILTPMQSATFFLFAGKNKYRQHFNFFKEDKQVNQILKMSQPTKKVKKQEQ